MRHGSLFSGIGGFDLAAEWMGWENVFHCEWNEFGQKVLKHYWPNAESFGDITKTDFTKYENTIDIISGGFPCQPYSLAGKRKGKEDERHLWPEMLRAIREIRPRWILGENVFGLINWSGGLVFDEVQTDLEAEGYEVFPYVLPACSKDAPHRRDRIWFVAHSNGNGGGGKNAGGNESEGEGGGLQEQHKMELSEKSNGVWESFTNSENIGHGNGTDNRGCERQAVESEQGWNNEIWSEPFGHSGDATNTKSKQDNGRGQGRLLTEFAGAIQCWQEFPTQSPLCNGDDGFPARLDIDTISKSKWRNESIKAGGNAVVPQVVYEIFKAIQSYDQQK
jgi:DNA (cytosine-5)-methyltransferase 1